MAVVNFCRFKYVCEGEFFFKFSFLLILPLIVCVIKWESVFHLFFCVEHTGTICLCQKRIKISVNRD